MLYAQVIESAALIYAEEQLIFIYRIGQRIEAIHLCLAALKPTRRACAGLLGILIFCGILNALVKCHGDSRAEVRLDSHALLGTHENLASVDMRGEIDALFFYLAELCERKDLKSAAVREYGPIPSGELMESAEFFHKLVARAQMQMICVAQLNLTVDILEVICRDGAFNRAAGCDIHKSRSLHSSVDGLEHAAAGCSLFFYNGKLHFYSFRLSYSISIASPKLKNLYFS